MRPTRRTPQRTFCQEGRTIRHTTRPLIALTAFAALLAGCGPAARQVSDPVDDPGDSTGVTRAAQRAAEGARRRIVNAGQAELTATRPDGSVAWTLSSESTRLGVQEGGGSQGFLEGVSGAVHDEEDANRPVSTFEADSAKADGANRTFRLIGNAQVRSVEYNAVLSADVVEWFEDRQLFVASGNVRIVTDAWTFGPTDVLNARPDLTLVGSPDRF